MFWLHITSVGVSFRLSFVLFRLTLTFPMALWLPRSGMLSPFPSFLLLCSWELFSSCLVVLMLFFGQNGGFLPGLCSATSLLLLSKVSPSWFGACAIPSTPV